MAFCKASAAHLATLERLSSCLFCVFAACSLSLPAFSQHGLMLRYRGVTADCCSDCLSLL